MPDINMSAFEEVQHNQLVTEFDIQTQVALDDYQVQLSDVANPTQSQDNVVIDRHGEFMPHWNESLDFDTWVKMQIEVSGKRGLLIHGNDGLSSVSSGSDVFPTYFTDFEDDDLSEWTNDIPTFEISTEQAVSGTKSLKLYKTTAGTQHASLPISGMGADTILDYDFYTHPSTNYVLSNYVSQSSLIGLALYNNIYASTGISNYYSATHHWFFEEGAVSTWYGISIHVDPSDDTCDIWVEGNLEQDGQPINSAVTALSQFQVGMGKSTATTCGLYIDNLRVRKYTATEPTYTIGTPKNISTALKSLGRAG